MHEIKEVRNIINELNREELKRIYKKIAVKLQYNKLNIEKIPPKDIIYMEDIQKEIRNKMSDSHLNEYKNRMRKKR